MATDKRQKIQKEIQECNVKENDIFQNELECPSTDLSGLQAFPCYVEIWNKRKKAAAGIRYMIRTEQQEKQQIEGQTFLNDGQMSMSEEE